MPAVVIALAAVLALEAGVCVAAPDGVPTASGARMPTGNSLRMRSDFQQRLRAAQEDADAGNYERALARLDAIQRESAGVRALNRYEQANLHYSYAFIHEARGKPAEAIAAYERVLKLRGLPASMELGARYNLARLYLGAEQWQQADAMLRIWLARSERPSSEARILRAQALYHLGRHGEARSEIDTALRLARQRQQPPQESWLVLLRAVAYESGNLQLTADTLLSLARQWPRKTYLLQLSGVYGELGDTPRQVAAMEAAWQAGWLTDGEERLALVYLYLEAGIPARAARMLESDLAAGRVASSAANVELLGLAWRRARDLARAMPALERAAAMANDAETWARLAGIELEERRPAEAASAARRALESGQITDPDSLRVILGTALYRLGQLQAAREVFAAVPRASGASADARRWLRFLDGELQREAALERDA